MTAEGEAKQGAGARAIKRVREVSHITLLHQRVTSKKGETSRSGHARGKNKKR